MSREKHVYLSEEDNKSLNNIRTRASDLYAKGDKETARALRIMALQLLNKAVIENLECGDIHDDECLLYMDLHKINTEMPVDVFKKNTMAIEINLIKDSPLYKDVVALLRKHLSDPQEA